MLGAVTAKRIKRTALNEGFYNSFINYTKVDPSAEIQQALKRRFLTLTKNGINRLRAYIFDSCQSETYRASARVRCKHRSTAIHIRW
ncbi:hypothetical protein D3C86_1877380 [compost metagenome]